MKVIFMFQLQDYHRDTGILCGQSSLGFPSFCTTTQPTSFMGSLRQVSF
jgi:hypothetical protein